MTTTTAPHPRTNIATWLIALIGVALAVALAFVLLDAPAAGRPARPATALPSGERIAYIEFGRRADTVWLASTQDPSARQALLSISHAIDFGAVPSLAPGASRFAYTALDPGAKPAPDAPAALWLAALAPGAQPELLAARVDLLVPAVWTPDGGGLVFRRSVGDTRFALSYLELEAGKERDLVAADEAALFPVAFAPDGARLYYVAIRETASDLWAVPIAGGEPALLARLAEGITRDWTLSPDGTLLSYLEMSFAERTISSRAFVLDLDGDAREAVGGGEDAFNPLWSADGGLTVGQVGGPVGRGDATSRLSGPERGFDVPLAWSPGGALAVSSFEGSSALAPGRSTLTVVAADGRRTPITSGEVTFLGWITP